MKTAASTEQETRFRPTLRPVSNQARYRKWRTMGGVVLCLLGLNATMRNSRAETLRATNPNAITTPDSGAASLYPSSSSFSGFPGKITAVRVTLHNISHTFPDDYDILLAGPGGQTALLMSDCGGDADLNNVIITFSDAGPPLPDMTQIVSGAYRPTNYSAGGNPNDTFPPTLTRSYSSSLAVFNNTSPNGPWSLYVVDDAAGDMGTIAGGWTLEVETTAFRSMGAINVPDSGVASPYPSQITVGGVPQDIRKVRVGLLLSHTFPDDLDIMLVGPGGQNAIIMSDVGGGGGLFNTALTLDDAAPSNLPNEAQIVDAIYKPTNIGAGDAFPGPAPVPAGTSGLSVFDGANPNGTWSLYVADDNPGNMGSVLWSWDFEPHPTVLANIATRLPVETGDNVLIGGFIVSGTQPKKVIVRAIGPSLPFAGKLADPTLELRDGNGGLIRFNDNWRSGSQGFPNQEAEIIATTIPPTNDLESAIVATLPANGAGYTAIVRGANNGTGIGVVEAYDLDRTVNSKFANIATRGSVQTGNNVLIAGIIVIGFTTQRVIVRAIGPSLSLAGKLSDPTLELRDANGGLIAFNNDWQDDQEADVIETTIPPPNSRESAIVATLPSNAASYSAIVRGLNGATGIAVVEVYALN